MSDILIDVKNLEKQYMAKVVVKDASFQVKQGMICGLVGPNGAGKTTIMKALGGLISPTKGSISIFGETDQRELAHSRSRMCFMIETPYAKQNMSAKENLEKLRMQKGLPDKKRVDEVLKLVGLDNVGKKPVKNYSLGMKQRLGIAGALLSKPEIMVLDEPVNGLDPEGIVEIRELLLKLNREHEITIVISSHLLSELSLLCTDYIFIRHGELMKKISADELRNECHDYFLIHTDNDSLVPAVLQNKLDITDIHVEKSGAVRVYEKTDDLRLISKTLYDNGIIPIELHMHDANLEQYYMNLVGEEDVQHNQGSDVSDIS